MTVGWVLLGAAARLRHCGWTQGAYARDAAGTPTGSRMPDAVCWCLDGALRATADFDVDAADIARDALASALGMSVTAWNDSPGRTKDEVIAALETVAAGGAL